MPFTSIKLHLVFSNALNWGWCRATDSDINWQVFPETTYQCILKALKFLFWCLPPKIPKEPYEPLLVRPSSAIHYSNKNMETRSNW